MASLLTIDPLRLSLSTCSTGHGRVKRIPETIERALTKLEDIVESYQGTDSAKGAKQILENFYM